jgi:hypothetical protein
MINRRSRWNHDSFRGRFFATHHEESSTATTTQQQDNDTDDYEELFLTFAPAFSALFLFTVFFIAHKRIP